MLIYSFAPPHDCNMLISCDAVTAYASRELADWMDKTRVLTTSGGSKLARALRGYRCNLNPSLRRITEKRQQDVHRSLKEEHLQWFGNRDHYKSKRVTSRRTNYTNANVNANAHTRMEDSGVGSPPLDKYEEEAMRLGELSKVHSKKFTAKKGLYDWEYPRSCQRWPKGRNDTSRSVQNPRRKDQENVSILQTEGSEIAFSEKAEGDV